MFFGLSSCTMISIAMVLCSSTSVLVHGGSQQGLMHAYAIPLVLVAQSCILKLISRVENSHLDTIVNRPLHPATCGEISQICGVCAAKSVLPTLASRRYEIHD